MLDVLGEVDKARITINGKGYKVTGEPERKVKRPSRIDDHEPVDYAFEEPLTAKAIEQLKSDALEFGVPVDEIADLKRPVMTAAESNRLEQAHRAFLQELGHIKSKILTLPPHSLIPRDGTGSIDYSKAKCDDWRIPLMADEDGTNYVLRFTFLTSEGLLSTLHGTDYEGLSYRPFNLSQLCQIFTFSAVCDSVDACGKTVNPKNAILVYSELETVFAYVAEPETRADKTQEKHRGPQSPLSSSAHRYVVTEWPKFKALRAGKLRATVARFFNHATHKDKLDKLGVKCPADVTKILDAERTAAKRRNK